MSGYWPLISPELSRDLDAGLWLVQSDFTWILSSAWSIRRNYNAITDIRYELPTDDTMMANNRDLMGFIVDPKRDYTEKHLDRKLSILKKARKPCDCDCDMLTCQS